MTGLELIKSPDTTAEQIADVVSEHCPPISPKHCDKLSCRKCWLAWLATGELPKEKGPSDKQTAPDEEGLHPNLVEMYAKAHRKAQLALHSCTISGSDVTLHPSPEQNGQQPISAL